MTVKELIEKLSEKDPNARVYWPKRQSNGITNEADPVERLIEAMAEKDPEWWRATDSEARKFWMTEEEIERVRQTYPDSHFVRKDRYTIKAVILC